MRDIYLWPVFLYCCVASRGLYFGFSISILWPWNLNIKNKNKKFCSWRLLYNLVVSVAKCLLSQRKLVEIIYIPCRFFTFKLRIIMKKSERMGKKLCQPFPFSCARLRRVSFVNKRRVVWVCHSLKKHKNIRKKHILMNGNTLN